MATLARPAVAAPLPPPPARPRIVELVGPAGVGKSAVAELLRSRGDVLVTSIWSVPLHRALWGAVGSLPSCARLAARARAALWRESKHIARLRSLHLLLDGDGLARYRLVVLDEGPVFTLAWLRAVGHAVFTDRRSTSWFRYTTGLWSCTLDHVLCLDAPDAVLAARIRTRRKTHPLRGAEDAVLHRFFGRFRAAFADVLGGLQRAGPTTVRSARTDAAGPECIAAELLETIGALGHG